MSRGVLCDVCGAVAPTTVARDFQTDGAPPDGWYGAFLTTGGSLQRPEAAGDLCSSTWSTTWYASWPPPE